MGHMGTLERWEGSEAKPTKPPSKKLLKTLLNRICMDEITSMLYADPISPACGLNNFFSRADFKVVVGDPRRRKKSYLETFMQIHVGAASQAPGSPFPRHGRLIALRASCCVAGARGGRPPPPHRPRDSSQAQAVRDSALVKISETFFYVQR